ncbi:MAG: hypothetical protein JW945_04575 [Methanomicrobia archaeon]|nr:hypothetical protein [Methanomicrobia archaeon]
MKHKRALKLATEVLGDVVASRTITNRAAFQRTLEEAGQAVTDTYPDVYAACKILKGLDEFGCALTSITDCYSIITTLLARLYPNRARFVLVYDYVDTGLETQDVSIMDGPAFHKASEMLSALKKSKLLFDMSVQDEVLDASLVGLINLILITKNTWSKRQFQIVEEYRKHKLQSEIAANLGISQQAVSKTLARTMWKELEIIEEKLDYALQHYASRVLQSKVKSTHHDR